MRLLITRHGETEENKNGILQGHLPGVLSDRGQEQARKLAERLKREKIDLIISSDLAKAFDTAKTIATFHPGINLITNQKLRERFLGNFQGKLKKEFQVPKDMTLSEYINSENAEDNEHLFERAGNLLGEVLGRSEKNILLVGHNRICKNFIGNLLNLDVNEGREKLENTSISEYIFEDEKWKEIKFNCTEHLK